MSTYNCSDPSSVSNGYYVVDKTYYENGDQVYFICFSDYSLNGNPTLTCDGATGNWSGTYPICSSTTTTTTTTAAPDYEGTLYSKSGNFHEDLSFRHFHTGNLPENMSICKIPIFTQNFEIILN